ncbi:MAG TPA: hypothetical protein VGO93_00360 [Candidatus Xenobia bacterium]|jgi:hypothetical protein
MDSFMIGLDVRPSGRARASIIEPAYDTTMENFSFPAEQAPDILDRRLDAWLELQPADFQIALCIDDPWPDSVVLQMLAPWRVTQYRQNRVDDICRQASQLLRCPLRAHRSKLLALMLKYDIGRATSADLARRWAFSMAREFLFLAASDVYRGRKHRDVLQALGRGV